MIYIKIIFLLLISSVVYANSINIYKDTKSLSILQTAQIYIDKNRNKTIEDIKKMDSLFEKNEKNILSFGYSPNFDVWVKFTISNNSDKTLNKIIEYNNSLSTNVEFFDPNKNYQIQNDGLLFNLSMSCGKTTHNFTRQYDQNAKKFVLDCLNVVANMAHIPLNTITANFRLFFPKTGAVVEQHKNLKPAELSAVMEKLENGQLSNLIV